MFNLWAVFGEMNAPESSTISARLDSFIPNADVRGRHETIIHAPAALVIDTARTLDLQSIPLVRAIFRLRARILGGKKPGKTWSRGFVEEALGMGWGVLAEEQGRFLIAGAACQPWVADVVFTPIPADGFAAFAEPDRVKIIWTLEAQPLGGTATRFGTETRAVGTDDEARRKLLRYWRLFGIGILAVRWLLLPAVRRRAERRWRQSRSPVNGRGHE
jgi:hypothetical protein